MLPTWFGLFIALILPGILAWGSQNFLLKNSLKNALITQIFLILQCISIILITIIWEHQTLISLGISSLHWQSLGWGLILGLFFIYIFSPVIYQLMLRANIPFFTEGLGQLTQLPTWYLIIAVITGGITEELLYRGYAVTRLADLSGNYWLAGIISTLLFALAHVPLWGWGAASTTLFSGAILTGFYIWQQDLIANIIAHILTDTVGIVLSKRK